MCPTVTAPAANLIDPLANVRIIEAVGIVSHEVVVSTATPDAWTAIFCAVAKGADFSAHRDAI